MKTILYVEDHPPARLLMQAIIDELTPHRLVVAGDGSEARRLVEAAPPDLYILDLDLPDIDGLALARALSAQHPAPVILVSAYAEAIHAEDLAGLVHVYLAKPLDPDHVAETIQRTLA
ncbi:MAG: response regulator [Anaerolineae bacterium]|nr:response regulator [Anaerolineae bacterium]